MRSVTKMRPKTVTSPILTDKNVKRSLRSALQRRRSTRLLRQSSTALSRRSKSADVPVVGASIAVNALCDGRVRAIASSLANSERDRSAESASAQASGWSRASRDCSGQGRGCRLGHDWSWAFCSGLDCATMAGGEGCVCYCCGVDCCA